MKVKMSSIVNSQEILKKFVAAEVKAKTAYQIKKLIDAVLVELKRFDEVRNNLVTKYADEQTTEEKEAKAPLKVVSKMEDFRKELIELLDEEVELNVVPIKISELEDLKLNLGELSAVENFIDFEDKKG